MESNSDTATAEENQARVIGEGFKIVSMKMKNAETGELLWQCDDWNMKDCDVKEVQFPKRLLQCKEVSREIVFSSAQAIQDFSLLQRISMNGMELEQMYFRFGFVIPGSTNSWDQVIYADTANMVPAEILSGNLLVETLFLSGENVINRSYYRVFYV